MSKKHVVSEEYAPKRVIKSTYGSISGFYPFKGSNSVRFESILERDYLARIETYPNVLNVVSQPLTLDFVSSSGRIYPYTPDYLVNFKGFPHDMKKNVLIEVKPNKLLKDKLSEWRNKFKAVFKYCNENDLIFHFMDETRIRDQRWENACFLKKYRKRKFDPDVSAEILNTLRQMGTATFDHLLTRHFYTKNTKALGISHLWHLIAIREIDCEMGIPFNAFTELWISDDEYK